MRDRDSRTEARTVGRVSAATAVVCGLLAACGVTPHHNIDAVSAASEISEQLAARYAVAAPKVTCPSGVRDMVGQTFRCQAVLDGEAVVLDATVTGSGGAFTVEPESAIVEVSAAVDELSRDLAAQVDRSAVVECGTMTVLVVKVGATFQCSATFAGEPPRGVTVTVDDIQGDFKYHLAPA